MIGSGLNASSKTKFNHSSAAAAEVVADAGTQKQTLAAVPQNNFTAYL